MGMIQRIAARYHFRKLAGPLTDPSKLRYQAVFMIGAGGSGKGYVGHRWLKYMPGAGTQGVSREDAKKAPAQSTQQRLLSDLKYQNAVADLQAKGFEIETVDSTSARIPFRLYNYDQKGGQQVIPPSQWESALPPSIYQKVVGLQDLVFSTPKHEIPSFWRQVNPDIFKEEISGYEPENPGYTHEMSSEMSKAYFEAAVETGDPLFIDGTGTNLAKTIQQMEVAKRHGYRTSLVYVWVPLTINHIRNALRSRNVNPNEVTRQWKIIDLNFERFKSVADKARKVDNRNDSVDQRAYEAKRDKVNAFIAKTTHYSSLRELILAERPEEISLYPWL